MSKAIKLQVAEPCHESWANMNPNEQGRFCLSCSKTVVDFSGMSDKQLYDYFKHYTGNSCGRLTDDQLNRNILAEPQKTRGWFKYALGVLVPALLLTNRGVAQGEIKKVEVVCKPVPKLVGDVAVLPPDADAKPHKVDSLPPVFVTAHVMGRVRKGTVGAVSIVRVQKINVFQKFAKFIADSLGKTFVIYPNPIATGATLKTAFKTGQGTYYIQLFDVNGILLQEEKMKSSFTLSKNIIPGHYTILLIDEKRKKIGSQQLIVH